jgi:hypothetical protein
MNVLNKFELVSVVYSFIFGLLLTFQRKKYMTAPRGHSSFGNVGHGSVYIYYDF